MNKEITIEVMGGMVVDVRGLPEGWGYHLMEERERSCRKCFTYKYICRN